MIEDSVIGMKALSLQSLVFGLQMWGVTLLREAF